MGERYNLIVLGAGSAARAGARKAAEEHDAKVALVESTRWGGSCPNVACKPTKAYLVAAELMRDVNYLAGEIGIEVGTARVDLAKVKARKDSLKKPQAGWVKELRGLGFDTYKGVAELAAPDTVRVDGEDLSAERVLIATGSRTAIPPIEGIYGIDWLDHITALELTELPETMLVVGAGPVGLELGQAFARFGSRVTIVDAADHIAARADRQAADVLAAALEAEDIELIIGSHVERVVQDDDEVVATIGYREARFSTVLLASGRAPNVEALNLERLGIERHRLGIVVDEHMRTTVEGVWAAGDATGMTQFTPIAQYQARLAVTDMFTDEAPAADYSILPTTIFTDPELAGVGLTEEEARAEGLDVEIVTHDGVTRAAYINAARVLYKLIYERESRRLRGIHVVARNGGEIVQGFSLGLRLGATVDDIAAMHHIYPTFGEGLKAAAEKAEPIAVEA
jgi:mercuric reductase